MLFVLVDVIHMANETMKGGKCVSWQQQQQHTQKEKQEEDTTKHKVNPCMAPFHSYPQHFPS
jgi:hypothetical protein